MGRLVELTDFLRHTTRPLFLILRCVRTLAYIFIVIRIIPSIYTESQTSTKELRCSLEEIMVQLPRIKSFGEIMLFLRKKCRDPLSNGILSQERLSEFIADRTNKPYSRNDVGEWEHNRSVIRQNNRELLVGLISVLIEYGGIDSINEADNFLITGDYRPLNDMEISKLVEWSGKALEREYPINKNVPQFEEEKRSAPQIAFSDRSPFLAPAIPPQGVFGREEALQKIIDILKLDDDKTRDIVPAVLLGMGGIGKTTLASAVAHNQKVQQAFRDGVLWATLGPNPAIKYQLNAWGRALGIEMLPERDDLSIFDQLRVALFQREMLLIIDDVWETTHGVSFQVGGPRCRTLFTTRDLSVANDLVTQNRVLRVDVLKPEASLQLLFKLAPEAVTIDENRAVRLCERLEYLPLGITLAGRLLANEADIPSRMIRLMSELIDNRDTRLRLLQSEGRQGLDEKNPVSLKAILGKSVDRLDKIDYARFARVSNFAGEPSTWDIKGASLKWNCSIQQAEDTISHFIQLALVERQGNRYWMHTLLVDYAADMLHNRSADYQIHRKTGFVDQKIQCEEIRQPASSPI